MAIHRRTAVAILAAALSTTALPALAQEYVAKIGHLESPNKAGM